MHKIILDEQDRENLRFQVAHSTCSQVRLRCIVILMRGMGLGQAEIQLSFGAATSSQTIWARAWKKGGLKALIEINHNGRKSSISKEQQETLAKAFEDNPPGTLAEAREEIDRQTGKRFSLEGVRKLIHSKLKLRRRKAKQVPPRCDDRAKKNEQDLWLSDKLEPLLAEAKAGKVTLWFVDAAHFTMQTCLGYVWSLLVCWVRSMSGRKRHSVLGALNACTLKMLTVTTDQTVNSETMKLLLVELHATKQTATEKVVLVLDNARYQHCAAVKEFALELGITLEFLPGYSPHLNLIERVWKFVRATALKNRFFDNFGAWSAAVDGCIDDMNSGRHDEALKSLLSWNFQSFEIDKIKT